MLNNVCKLITIFFEYRHFRWRSVRSARGFEVMVPAIEKIVERRVEDWFGDFEVAHTAAA